jgi:hypothetical protein
MDPLQTSSSPIPGQEELLSVLRKKETTLVGHYY